MKNVLEKYRKKRNPILYRRRQWHPTPELLPGKYHGWRSLVGCSPWDCEESDMTERLHFHFSLSWTGEGNGNPLQCSCLENPRDGGAWWAAVYGVAQSRTRPKWLRSSSCGSCWRCQRNREKGSLLPFIYFSVSSQCLPLAEPAGEGVCKMQPQASGPGAGEEVKQGEC